MPWLEIGAVDQRLRFVAERLSGEASMTELCEAYGISRRVGYKWLARYEAEGPAGLADRSHAPLRHGRATPPELVEKIVDLRRARPHWGARKIVARLSVAKKRKPRTHTNTTNAPRKLPGRRPLPEASAPGKPGWRRFNRQSAFVVFVSVRG
jgi:transposase-like protein